MRAILRPLLWFAVAGIGLAYAQTVGPAPGGGGGSVSVTAATPNVVINPSPGLTTFTVGTTAAAHVVGTSSYTVLNTDAAKTIELTYTSGSIAVTLPNVSASGFGAGFQTAICNLQGASTNNATITVNSPSLIWAASSVALAPNTCSQISDLDGTTYVAYPTSWQLHPIPIVSYDSNTTVVAGTSTYTYLWAGAGSITAVYAQTGGTGTPSFTVDIKKNGTDVTGCNAISVTATPATTTCTTTALAQGDILTAVVSSPSGTPDLANVSLLINAPAN